MIIGVNKAHKPSLPPFARGVFAHDPANMENPANVFGQWGRMLEVPFCKWG